MCSALIWGFVLGSTAGARTARSHLGWRENLQVQLFVEYGELTLGARREQFGRHRGQQAVVAGRMFTQGLAERRRHQAGVAGLGQHMVEATPQFVATGGLQVESGTDATSQRDEFFAAQFFVEAGVARQHDTQQ